MILILPDWLGTGEYLEKAAAFQLAPGEIGQKRTPLPGSDRPVDFLNQIFR